MDNSNLSPEEQAYFDSRGEALPPGMDQKPAPAPEAAEEAAAPEPETVIDEADDDVGEPARQSMVPHKALHAEREKRKALEKELSEAREFRIRMEERMRYVQEQEAKRAAPQQQQDAEPETPPDPDEDVFAATKFALKQQEQLKRQIEEQKQTHAQEIQYREMIMRTEAHEKEFRRAQPDYDSAIQHLRNVREQELEVLGKTNPAERAAFIQQEALQIAATALRMGKSPAEVAYTLARARGYQPSAGAIAPQDGDDRMDRAKAQSKSLSAVGGAPTGPMTVERLAKMSMKEFTDYERKNPDKVRALMGG